jgi:hypothetical protein
VINNIGNVLRREAEIHRVQDGAHHGDGPVRLQVVVRIPREGADAVTRGRARGCRPA